MIKRFILNRLLPKLHKFYLGINLKQTPLIIEPETHCLLLAPHADDESIGVGGLLLKKTDNFEVICLTNGIKGAKALDAEEAKDIRRKEFQDAMEFAEVKNFKMMDIEDKSIVLEYDKFKTIDISKADYIFIPNILDQHQDHKAVSFNLRKLLHEKKHKKSLKIAMYEVWSALILPNVYVDITEVAERKKQLINCHKSQVDVKGYVDKALALNSYRGLNKNLDYAEVFSVLEISTFEELCKIVVDIN